jgi:hypothetical protein
MQAALPLVLAATYPTPPNGLGLLDIHGRSEALIPFSVMFLCGLVNWAVVGPATTASMKRRKHQETREGKKYWEEGPKSEAMKSLNKEFSKLHGISSLVNLVEILVTVYYGVVLSQRLV